MSSSCEPIVWDRARGDGTLVIERGRCVPFSDMDELIAEGLFESLIGEIASSVVFAPESRGGSNILPGCNELGLLVAWDKVELFDVFRRS